MTAAAGRCEVALRANQGELAGRQLLFDRSGALLDVASSTLIIADLHFEKAAAFARGGQMLPPYETEETIRRLQEVVDHYQPARLVLLGDSFHARAEAIDLEARPFLGLRRLARQTALIWITGNHDPQLPAHLPGIALPMLALDGIRLRHAPEADGCHEIVGHLHPAARVATRAGSRRRRCFLVTPERVILPAFGALTGSRDIFEAEFAGLFDPVHADVHLIGGTMPHRFPVTALQRQSGF